MEVAALLAAITVCCYCVVLLIAQLVAVRARDRAEDVAEAGGQRCHDAREGERRDAGGDGSPPATGRWLEPSRRCRDPRPPAPRRSPRQAPRWRNDRKRSIAAELNVAGHRVQAAGWGQEHGQLCGDRGERFGERIVFGLGVPATW